MSHAFRSAVDQILNPGGGAHEGLGKRLHKPEIATHEANEVLPFSFWGSLKKPFHESWVLMPSDRFLESKIVTVEHRGLAKGLAKVLAKGLA